MRRSRLLTAVFMVTSLVFAACQGGTTASPGGTGGTPPASQAGSAASQPASAASQPASAAAAVELTILEHQDPRLKELKALLPKFEAAMKAAGKNITVKVLEGPAPDTEFRTKLTLDYNAGNAADVVSYGSSWVPDFVSAGYLLDLTERLNGWADYQHFYKPLREQSVQADGKVYGVPREASIQQLFYRKDVLDKAGVSTAQPKSWDELITRMNELKPKLGKPPILFPAGKAWGGGTFDEGFTHLMLGTDSPLYDAADGKWIVKSPGLTSVFKFYETLTKDKLLPTEALLNPEPWVPTKYTAFPKGELAVATCGTWCWIFDWGPGTKGEIPDIFNKVATWEFPTEKGGTFVTGGLGWVYAISAKSKHPDEAFELVKWLTSGEAMATNAVTIGAAAPRDDIQDVAPYSGKPFLIDAEKRLTGARAFQAPAGVDKIQQLVGEFTEEVITGRMTGDAAAAQFSQRATDALGAEKVKQSP